MNQTTDIQNWDQIRMENETQVNFGNDWTGQQAPDTWGAPDISPNNETVDNILWRQDVRVLVTCLISNVVTNPCSRPKPTRTGGHVIWSSGIAAMPILHSPDCPTMLGKFHFPEPESDSNSRPMDRVALGCHKGS